VIAESAKQWNLRKVDVCSIELASDTERTIVRSGHIDDLAAAGIGKIIREVRQRNILPSCQQNLGKPRCCDFCSLRLYY